MRRLTQNDLKRLVREELIRSNYRNNDLLKENFLRNFLLALGAVVGIHAAVGPDSVKPAAELLKPEVTAVSEEAGIGMNDQFKEMKEKIEAAVAAAPDLIHSFADKIEEKLEIIEEKLEIQDELKIIGVESVENIIEELKWENFKGKPYSKNLKQILINAYHLTSEGPLRTALLNIMPKLDDNLELALRGAGLAINKNYVGNGLIILLQNHGEINGNTIAQNVYLSYTTKFLKGGHPAKLDRKALIKAVLISSNRYFGNDAIKKGQLEKKSDLELEALIDNVIGGPGLKGDMFKAREDTFRESRNRRTSPTKITLSELKQLIRSEIRRSRLG